MEKVFVKQGRGREIIAAARMPLILLTVAIVLWAAAKVIQGWSILEILKLSVFAVACIAAFHLTFFLGRRVATEKAIKASDYIFLGLAFYAVNGVFDVHATIAKARYPVIMNSYGIDLGKRLGCDPSKSTPVCLRHLDLMSAIQRTQVDAEVYISRVGEALNEVIAEVNKSSSYDIVEGILTIIGAHNIITKMSSEGSHMVSLFLYNSDKEKVFAFYALCIGLALRISKVSAEVFEWHIPKPKPDQQPRYPRGPHNAVWLKRKLARQAGRRNLSVSS